MCPSSVCHGVVRDLKRRVKMNEITPIDPDSKSAIRAVRGDKSEFNYNDWRDALLKLNPWAKDYLKDGIGTATEKFSEACLLASQARWLAGSDIWNGWADGMLAQRRSLEAAQLWYVGVNGEGANDETRAWLALADCVFSGLTLERGRDGCVNFEGFVFPSTAWFVDTLFTGEIRMRGAKFLSASHFSRARFIGKADFENAQFHGHARFKENSFTGSADFAGAEFHGDAHFERTIFTGGTNFNAGQFNGETNFSDCRFIGDATYEDVKFTGDVAFKDVQFAGTSWFPRASFVGHANFSGAVMTGDAWFSNSKFVGNVLFDETKFPYNSRFENAEFLGLASFRNAEFSDNTVFAHASFTGETGLDAESLPETAEVNTITITGPLREERERMEMEEKFPSLVKQSGTTLEGAEFKNAPDFEGAKSEAPPKLDDMTVVDPIKNQHDWDGSKKKSRDR